MSYHKKEDEDEENLTNTEHKQTISLAPRQLHFAMCCVTIGEADWQDLTSFPNCRKTNISCGNFEIEYST